MADLYQYIPNTKLTAAQLNAMQTELASRIAAVASTAAAGVGAAAIADSDALAARAAATAADTHAGVAQAAAGAAQATATGAATVAAAAKAEADTLTTNLATTNQGLAANVQATTTAQGRADAAFALAQAGGSGGGGGGSSGGPTPSAASFNLVNFDSGSSLVDLPGGKLLATITAPIDQINLRLALFPRPAPPYYLRFKLTSYTPNSQWYFAGVGEYETDNGKAQLYGTGWGRYGEVITLQSWTTTTSAPGNEIAVGMSFAGQVYLEHSDDGNTVNRRYSRDGNVYVPKSYSAPSLVPDQLGLAFYDNDDAPTGQKGIYVISDWSLVQGLPPS